MYLRKRSRATIRSLERPRVAFQQRERERERERERDCAHLKRLFYVYISIMLHATKNYHRTEYTLHKVKI